MVSAISSSVTAIEIDTSEPGTHTIEYVATDQNDLKGPPPGPSLSSPLPIPTSPASACLDGLPGDPVNLALIGASEQLRSAFAAAGWSEADRLGIASSWRMVRAFVFNKAYPSTEPMLSRGSCS